MVRIFREMDRAVAMLPLWLKIFIGLVLAAEFIVITQWDRLTAKQPPTTTAHETVSPQKPDHRFDFPEAPPADKAKAAEIQAALAKRMDRVVITDPIAQPDGTILSNGQTFHLYGIKPFDSKKLCTRASGERWACGLYAYADLRNTIAHKMIICDPRAILPNAVTAVCHLGATDIAAMLVRNGLADVEKNNVDPAVLSAQSFAKSQKLGVWDR